MRILLMDMASSPSVVALLDGGDLVVREFGQGRAQNVEIFPVLEELLGERRLDGLDMAVAMAGPGSFTGIRLGLAIIRGFRMAGVRVGAISCFDAARISLGLGPVERVALPAGLNDVFVSDVDGERVEDGVGVPVAFDYGKILAWIAAGGEVSGSLNPLYVKPHYAQKVFT